MKTLIVLFGATLLSASSIYAADCPNFAGTYQLASDPSSLTLTLTQDQCNTVTFNYVYANGENLGKTYPMDNVRRQTYEDKNVIVYETSGVKDNALENLVEDFEKATAQTSTAVSTTTIDDKGNLDNKDNYYDPTGKLTQSQDIYFVRVAK
jgi:carbonic anhydrase